MLALFLATPWVNQETGILTAAIWKHCRNYDPIMVQ